MVADAGSAGFVLAAAMAAALYGASDFLSGLAARSASVRGTAVLVQVSALLAFVLALPLASVRDWPSPHGFLWAVVGGASSAVASLVYFRGLAKGTMGMVALVVGVLTIVLPVAVGMAWGEHVSGLALAGIAGAIGSVVLASNVDFRRALPVGNGMLESLVSGVLFALMFVSLSRLASGLNVVTFVVFQAVNVAVTVLVGYGQVRAALRDHRRQTAMAIAAGLLGALGNLCFFEASHAGRLAVASAIAALSPFVVIVFARVMLRERLNVLQKLGSGLALCCVWLISLG